jgi:pyruvate/2-oxoacid:ferredoxin oxidoreductase beta subunit/Pyruvate/2-oxoacid:ferredoxin oxidoreductase gamma subunit
VLNYTSYLNEQMLPYPFCPGCGHAAILDQLNAALVQLQLDPRKVVIVTDIGCAGLSDRFFVTHAFHGLHGRSLTYATGIKLVDPELKVIVLIGDGGCGIGGSHLINAARRNIGTTVLVFNNLNYGMTGGEHSVTTPAGAITATTPFGNLERPMDVCATAAVNGASFVARTTAFDQGLPGLIAQAIQNEGFSLIDIWELCVAYFVPNNRFSRKLLEETMAKLGFATGILHQQERDEYSRAYRHAIEHLRRLPAMPAQPMQVHYGHKLNSPLDCLIAGAAGMRIGSAASAFSRGAVLCGLWASLSTDYPVTVRSGFSLAEVKLSLERDGYGAQRKRLLVVLFPEGLEQVRPRLLELSPGDLLYVNADLLPLETRARVVPLDFSAMRRKAHWSIIAMAEVLRHAGIYPLEALRDAIAQEQRFADENLAAVDSGLGELIPPGN